MVRVLDVDTQAAIRDRRGLVPRNFIVFTAKDRDTGAASVRAFWNDAETVAVQVRNETGDLVAHDFTGDGAILSMDAIPMKLGLEVRTIQITMSALHAEVQNLIRGDDPRLARVEIYRGLLSPASMLLVAPPRLRFLGQVNGTPIDTAPAGGESTVTVKVVSHTRELTRTNPARKGDEQQRRRSGDRFRRYTSVAGDWPIWWGEAQRKTKK
jgi:hypothetical protein